MLYRLDPRSRMTAAAVALLALSMALRLVWILAFPEELRGTRALIHGVLPLTACTLFIAALALGGGRVWITFIPTLMGVIFFILKAAGFGLWHRIGCTTLYLGVLALYGAAVLGLAPVKPLLIPLFGLPLAFHILDDIIFCIPVYTAGKWLQELSVLCIMGSLLLVSLGLERTDPPAPRQAGQG